MKSCYTTYGHKGEKESPLVPYDFYCVWEQRCGQDPFESWVGGGKGRTWLEAWLWCGLATCGVAFMPQRDPMPRSGLANFLLLWGWAEAGIKDEHSHNSVSTFSLQTTISWGCYHPAHRAVQRGDGAQKGNSTVAYHAAACNHVFSHILLHN